MKKGKLLIIVAIVIITVMSCDEQSDVSIIKRPNIIHILADDLGYGEVGFNGSSIIKTPNLDKLAGDGLRFSAAYVTSPVCAPARAGLISGFHAGHAYVDRNSNASPGFREGDPTIGTVLKNAGYVTAVFGKWGFGGSGGTRAEPQGSLLDSLRSNPIVGNPESLPRNQGYDYFYGYLNHTRAHSYYVDSLWEENINKGGGINLKPTGNSAQMGRVNYSHKLIARSSEHFIEENANKDKPFYMQINYTIPHASWDDIVYVTGAIDPYSNTELDWTARNTAAMITYMDKSIGDLIARLKDPNNDGDNTDSILSDTVIFFTSDNGADYEPRMVPLASNAPFRGGKWELYEGGIRVPMFVYWVDKDGEPRINTGVSELATDIADFLPTAAAIAETIGPVGIDGISLVPTITGQGEQRLRDYLYFENNELFSFRPDTGIQEICHRWAVLDTRSLIKLIYWEGEKGTAKENQSGYELYDLKNDQQEANDLLAYPENPAYKEILEIKEKLIQIAKSEGAGKDDEYSVSYLQWIGGNGGTISDANNWINNSIPSDNYSITISNKSEIDHVAFLKKDLEVLGIEVFGKDYKQSIVVEPGISLTGKNEVRIGEYGHVHLNYGSLHSKRWLTNKTTGVLSGMGVIKADVYNDGEIRPGGYDFGGVSEVKENMLNSQYHNTLLIEGSYTHAATADMVIQIGKSDFDKFNQPIHSKVKVTGEVVLMGGFLTVKLADNYIPDIGESFLIFEAEQISGKFDAELLPKLGDDKRWSTENLYETGEIRVLETY